MNTVRRLFVIGVIILVLALVLGLIGKILSNTMEIASHNLKGASGNTVYISEDGHKEAVYDVNGNLVTDPINMGSYNNYYYKEYPYRHFFFDTVPWIFWGNAKNDNSTVKERIVGFNMDFNRGVRITFKLE
ncbi:MAG: hypothetical protein Q8936_13405 [Bacillota bacterium]|nr:hypothetical protein [Bacillota bacterium]